MRWKYLFGYYGRYKLKTFIIAALCIVSTLCSLATPALMSGIVDEGIKNGDFGTVLSFCLIMLAVAAVALFSAVWSAKVNASLANLVARDIRDDLFEKVNSLSFEEFSSIGTSSLLTRATEDVSNLQSAGGLINTVVSVPLSLALSGFLATRSEKHYYEVRKINGSICALAEEDFTCFDTVRAFDIAKKQNTEFRRRSENLRKAGEKGAFLSAVVTPVITFANALTYVFICALGGYFAVIGKFGVGKIVKIILYSQMLQGPLESLAGGFSSMQNTLAAARRVYDFLDSDEMAEDDGITLSDPKGDVSFENVNFAYTPDKPLIRDFSVDIKAGQKCAIVGPTGCGKTTLVNLLMRFYEVDSGSIKIDGTDIRDMSKTGVRSLFQMVLQDVWLFSGSIRDNVAYGREDATDEEIEEACRRARIDGFIRSLPEGYDTVLNEETADISGGQKQLLTIARAFLADRKLLILDEATSGVDTRTEVQIQQSMKELTKGRTSFVIAHRLSTVTDADVILVMSDGRLVEKGTHEELLEKRGFYYDIFMSQFDG